ncbi:MAG: isoprenylcysteine carboxylmethyltransferase family protein [Desulfamplus sp.]|nr:isoprenylcysteine carboxylmethyltransferase family protein [Desulfamplus sp.]
MKLMLKIPPVAQGIIAIFLIWLFARYVPIYNIKFKFQNIAGWIFIITGVLIAFSGVLAFIKSKTTVDPRSPDKASKLVIVGIYRYSRNPMYLGIMFVLTGVALLSAALSAMFVIPLFAAFINRYQIMPEELALEEKFGEAYIHYLKNVRKWL